MIPREFDLPAATVDRHVRVLSTAVAARPGPRRRTIVAAVAVLAALVAVGTTPALGVRDRIVDLFTLGEENRQVGVWSLPGRPNVVPPALAERATLSGVSPESLREIAAAEGLGSRTVLFAGRGPDGTTWIATWPVGLIFRPLAEVLDDRRRLAPFSGGGGEAMLIYPVHGGAKPTAVDYVAVMGFVRSDVVRVTLVLRDGRERDIPLNAWRGFGFTEREAAPLVTAIRAYDADGDVLDEATLHVGPLCGGDAGPCTDVEP